MKNITWSWDEPEEDAREDEIDFPEEIVPTEEEWLSLLEPAPFESGVCKGCGEGIVAGMQHAHKCLKDQRVDPRWQWEERRYELERLAYCGYED